MKKTYFNETLAMQLRKMNKKTIPKANTVAALNHAC